MRARRVLGLAAVCVAVVGWSGRNAQAAAVTYDLAWGQLTNVWVGGADVLGGAVELTDATATIDFDPAVLAMSNLFVEAGTVLNLQSTGTIALIDRGTFYELGNGPVLIDGALLGGAILANVTGSQVRVGPDGLAISMTGLANWGTPGSVLPTVKVDYFFIARSTQPGTAPIPEPGSDLLFPAGLALLGLILRTRQPTVSC